MPDHPTRDLDSLWRKAHQQLRLVDREPALTMEQIDRLLAAGTLEDKRLRLPRAGASITSPD
jgi:hypothetical protein